MAGDWIPVRHDLDEELEVVRIVSAICPQSVRDLSERMRTTSLVVGALQRTWRLFDKLTEDGVLVGYSPEWLDSHVGIEGFSELLELVGWLDCSEPQALIMPGFEEYLGQCAKRRLQDAKRKRNGRKMASAKRPQNVRKGSDKMRTTEQNRTVLNKESKPKKSKPTKSTTGFTKPTLDDVREYCHDRGNSVDPERFVDHYESNGWMVGRTKMRDWRAAVRNWEKNSSGYPEGSEAAEVANRDQAKADETERLRLLAESKRRRERRGVAQ